MVYPAAPGLVESCYYPYLPDIWYRRYQYTLGPLQGSGPGIGADLRPTRGELWLVGREMSNPRPRTAPCICPVTASQNNAVVAIAI